MNINMRSAPRVPVSLAVALRHRIGSSISNKCPDVIGHEISKHGKHVREFARVAPAPAGIVVMLICVMAFLSPMGLAVLVLSSALGAGFSAPQSHLPPALLDTRCTPPVRHEADIVEKNPVGMTSTRQGDSYYFATQSFPRSVMWMLLQNRLKIADLVASVLGGLFVWYAAEPLGTTSAKLAVDLFCGNFATYIWLNTIHWLRSVRPLPGKTHADARSNVVPFLKRSVHREISRHTGRGHSIPHPDYSSEDFATKRGFTTVGIEYGPFIFDLLTWAIEYKVRAFGRIIMYDLGLAPGPTLSGRNVYLAIVNTSLACWFDPTTSELVFHNVLLPHNSVDIKLWAKISLEIDVTKQTVGRLCMEPCNHGKTVDVVCTANLPEICSVVHTLWSFVAHPNAHYWANAMEDVTTAEWKLSTVSHNVTQGFNNGAVFSTAEVMGHTTSPHWMGMIGSHAFRNNGIPDHTSVHSIAAHSTAHRMISACRVALKSVSTLALVHRLKREAIIQTTVMHALDHHYMAKYLPTCCNSELLNTSTQMVAVLTRPFTYKSRKLMMKDHVATDEVCRVLYDACASVDQQFANESLTIGVLV